MAAGAVMRTSSLAPTLKASPRLRLRRLSTLRPLAFDLLDTLSRLDLNGQRRSPPEQRSSTAPPAGTSRTSRRRKKVAVRVERPAVETVAVTRGNGAATVSQ